MGPGHEGGVVAREAYSDTWPRSVMDNASDFGSEDCGFESHRGRICHSTGRDGLDVRQSPVAHTAFVEHTAPLSNSASPTPP